jgi:hypothetical protein
MPSGILPLGVPLTYIDSVVSRATSCSYLAAVSQTLTKSPNSMGL